VIDWGGATADLAGSAVTTGPYARRSARVLLVDDLGRLLLLCYLRNPSQPDLGTIWFTPGGGVLDGETLAETAVRELREEIGLAVAPEALGEPVAFTAGQADLGWANGWFRDDFFFHRTSSHIVATGELEEFERRALVGHRWWSLTELVSTEQSIVPLRAAPLLADLLAGHRPGSPVELPWHH
jgi:8-oxo-dGTP pyrophosphatase MutT (NUDIX family)